MRKIPFLLSGLMTPVLPVLVAGPAHAADHVICVAAPVGVTCDESAVSVKAAINLAESRAGDEVVRVGAGEFTDGPYTLSSGVDSLTLQGSGALTVITLPPGTAQTYINAHGATIRDLKVVLNPTTSDNDKGIYANENAVLQDVVIDGSTAENATGVQLKGATLSGGDIRMKLNAAAWTTAVYGEGGSMVVDSRLQADQAFNHSGEGVPDELDRVSIKVGSGSGVATDSGSVVVENTLIDLGTTGSLGIEAANFNNSTSPRAVSADHVTIVGGRSGSVGVYSRAASPGALQVSSVGLTNSIVRGPTTSLRAEAGNNGAQGGNSTATIDVSHTDYVDAVEAIGPNGAGGVNEGAGNLLDVDPAFVDPAAGNYRLQAGSPVIDQGDPTPGSPSSDLDLVARPVDGDFDGTSTSDLGAYEFRDVTAPQTLITGAPGAATRDTTPTFRFSSEAGATFQCQVDAGAYQTCTSPFTAPVLSNAKHTFRVRAADKAGNLDATPATHTFKVDTIAPTTRLVRKPNAVTTRRTVVFGFRSNEAGVRFQCKVDGRAWRWCTSPRSVTIAKGVHVFRVRARDAAGNIDPTPAVHRFRRI